MSRLSFRARKRLALFTLVVGLPIYIVAAVTLVGWLDRPGGLVELAVFVVLGVVWALPLRPLFRGVAREAPGGEAAARQEGD